MDGTALVEAAELVIDVDETDDAEVVDVELMVDELADAELGTEDDALGVDDADVELVEDVELGIEDEASPDVLETEEVIDELFAADSDMTEMLEATEVDEDGWELDELEIDDGDGTGKLLEEGLIAEEVMEAEVDPDVEETTVEELDQTEVLDAGTELDFEVKHVVIVLEALLDLISVLDVPLVGTDDGGTLLSVVRVVELVEHLVVIDSDTSD